MTDNADDLTGTTLSGRYEIKERVGEGAMGAVYRAHHTFIDKSVAVKVLHPRFSTDPEIVERFQREAQAAAHIEHPNICSATDFGRIDQSAFFLVMEWLDGESLEELLDRERPLEPARACRIASQIALALEKAHELAIVHRDLKPANIMLIDRQGEEFVKVTDFGIAQVRLNDSVKITQAGAAYGTPAYMSPEQAAAREIDGRSDIYAVGVILYEMLVGQPPFDDRSIPLIMAKHVTDTPPPFAQMNPDVAVPKWLEDVVMKCLTKDPDDRPQTGNELAALLLDEPDAFAITQRKTAVATALVHLSNAVEKSERKAPVAIYGGIAITLIILVVVVMGLITGGIVSEQVGEIALENIASERESFSKQPEIAKALALNAEGKTTQATKALENAKLNYDSNAHYHFLVGTLHLQQKSYDKAFLAFERAAKIDDRYVRDEGLRKALLEAVGSSNKNARKSAANFLSKNANDALRETLFETFQSTEKRRDRRRIANVLEEAEQFKNYDTWQRNTLILRSHTKCNDIKMAVKSAVDDGDKRIAPALRYVYNRPKKGCGFLNTQDCLKCARDDIKAAFDEIGVSIEDPKKQE